MNALGRVWSRVYYWIIIVLPIVAFGVLAANGRWREFWSLFQHPDAATEEAFQRSFTTALIWSLSTLPISLTAWYLGRRHTAARRINSEVVVGFREIFRRAIGRDLTPRQLEAMARPPKDRVGIALLLGIVVALLVPAFFLVFMPILRTPRGAVWLGGAGILIGATIYCQRRASAYLIDEPEAFDLFRQYRLLNEERYQTAGHPFVRAQLILMVALPIWWLGGAAVVFMR